MNALILAAGLGTRLGQLTADRPKALVQVNDHSMLRWQLQHLSNQGFDHFIVNVHHFAGQVIQYLEDKRYFGLDITVSDESDLLLDTGGGIRKCMHMFGGTEPVLVHNVDIFSSANAAQLYRVHAASGRHATLLTATRKTSRYLYFDQDGRLHGWADTRSGLTRSPYADFRTSGYRALAFQGIHVLSPSILPYLDSIPDPAFSITNFYVDHCSALNIGALEDTGMLWADAGRPETLPLAAQIADSIYK